MKLIFIHPYWDVWGGAENYMTMLYNELKKNHDCVIYSIYNATQPVEGLQYLQSKPKRSLLFGVKFNPSIPKYADEVAKLLKDKKCDVVISGNWPATMIVEKAYTKYNFRPKKKIHICFEPDNGFHHMKLFGKFPLNENAGLFDKARARFSKIYLELGRRRDIKAVKEQDLILTLSENVGKNVLKVFFEEPICLTAYEKMTMNYIKPILFDCVDTQKIFKDDLLGIRYKRKLGIDDKKVILSLGRVEYQVKRIDRVLEIAKIICRNMDNVIFLIAGKGTYLETLKNKIKECGLDEKVKCLGFVPDSELNDLYNACDVFLDTSDDEPSGSLTMVEAMACGKPVIASNSGGHDETITNGMDGILIEPDNIDSYVENIKFLLENEKNYDFLSKNAKYQTKKRSKEALIKVFEGVLNE